MNNLAMNKREYKKFKVGEKYNHWTIKELVDKTKALCACKCGKEKVVGKSDIKYGKSKSCGCMRGKYIEETCLEKYGVKSSALDPKIKSKRLQTLEKNHGVINAFQSKEVKDKIKQTNLEKYGKENPSQVENIKNKKKNTSLTNWGVENPSQCEEIQKRKEKTCMKNYGVRIPWQSQIVRDKQRQTNLERYGVEHYVQLPENRHKLKDWCEENPHLLFQSKPELEILEFIQEHYPSAHKIKQEGYELDIFIPELNLGIEHNGLYWHSEINKPKNYHLDKTNFFKEKDIRAIHIWEHEWQFRQAQVKSFLLSAINKNEYKIGARKCKFIFTDSKEEIAKAQELLENTHIQGRAHSVKYVANVYYDEELIATATFGFHHRNSKQYVLSRFTTKTNYTIQGCLSKISKLAYKNLQTPIISWADYRLSDGNGYLKAGWNCEELLGPDYFYFGGGSKIISKQSRQKKIVGTSRNMTEREHAELDGLIRVYDCGKIRFVYNHE